MDEFDNRYTPLYEYVEDLKKIDITFYVVYDAISDKTYLHIRNLRFIADSFAEVIVLAWNYYYKGVFVE